MDSTISSFALGYKGYVIKEYFANYFLHMSDVTFHLAENRMEVHRKTAESWRVTLVDTGEETMTGGRLKRAFLMSAMTTFLRLPMGTALRTSILAEELAFHKSAWSRRRL